MVKYGKKLVYVDGVEIKLIMSPNGHYMINIFDDLNNILPDGGLPGHGDLRRHL